MNKYQNQEYHFDGCGLEPGFDIASISFPDPSDPQKRYCVGLRPTKTDPLSQVNPSNWRLDHVNHWNLKTFHEDGEPTQIDEKTLE